MIKKLSLKDSNIIYKVINEAVRAYRGVIPEECYHEPYMSKEELHREIVNMTFFGWEQGGKNIGVIGIQTVKDITLVRHTYVLPECQRKGIGTKLINQVKQMTKTKRLLVGTWADSTWAIQFYRKHGFELMPEKDELLRKYWNVPQRQIETSVVLGLEM
jgi:GNAT superfamily N-acetyltransferase